MSADFFLQFSVEMFLLKGGDQIEQNRLIGQIHQKHKIDKIDSFQQL